MPTQMTPRTRKYFKRFGTVRRRPRKKNFVTLSVSAVLLVSYIVACTLCPDKTVDSTIIYPAVADGTRRYTVTCIGDSNPNGNCMGGSACSPNGSPKLGLQYTNDPTYETADGTTLVIAGASNGDKRSDYHYYLPEDVTPETYEAGALQTYPVLVAEAVNGITPGSITNIADFYEQVDYHAMSAAMVRSCDVLYALDNLQTNDDALWNLPVTAVKREDLTAAVNDGVIEDSDIIIMAFGGNDVFAGPLYSVMQNGTGGLKAISVIIDAVKSGIEDFSENLPAIMELIRERNEDCTIVLVSVANPLDGYTLHDLCMLFGTNTGIWGRLLPVGNLANVVLSKLNKVLQNLAETYENVIYVDTYGATTYLDELAAGLDTEIPTASMEGQTTDGTDASPVSSNPLTNGIHPTVKGHAEIACRIVAALGDNDTETKQK